MQLFSNVKNYRLQFFGRNVLTLREINGYGNLFENLKKRFFLSKGKTLFHSNKIKEFSSELYNQ